MYVLMYIHTHTYIYGSRVAAFLRIFMRSRFVIFKSKQVDPTPRLAVETG